MYKNTGEEYNFWVFVTSMFIFHERVKRSSKYAYFTWGQAADC